MWLLACSLVLAGCSSKDGGLVEDRDGGDAAGPVDGGPDGGPAERDLGGVTVDFGAPDLGECSPEREDPPDPYYFDADCDGIDGSEMDSVFVATYGDDANPGTRALPKLTIQAAINAAEDGGKSWVLVGDGIHEAGFTLADGIGIAGGYGSNWRRDTFVRTTLRGGNPAILADSITSETLLIGFEVEPTREPQPGETVVTILAKDSAGLRLHDLRVIGGTGGPGASGSAGSDGAGGGDGGRGEDGREDSDGLTCDEDGQPQAGLPGESECDAAGGTVAFQATEVAWASREKRLPEAVQAASWVPRANLAATARTARTGPTATTAPAEVRRALSPMDDGAGTTAPMEKTVPTVAAAAAAAAVAAATTSAIRGEVPAAVAAPVVAAEEEAAAAVSAARPWRSTCNKATSRSSLA